MEGLARVEACGSLAFTTVAQILLLKKLLLQANFYFFFPFSSPLRRGRITPDWLKVFNAIKDDF